MSTERAHHAMRRLLKAAVKSSTREKKGDGDSSARTLGSLLAYRRDGSNCGLIRQSGVAHRGPQAPGVSLAWKYATVLSRG